VAEGARTGLANVATAALFLAALFFAPVVAMVGGGVSVGRLYYYPITAPVVILVGSLMMGQQGRIPWRDPTEAIPAFVTRARGLVADVDPGGMLVAAYALLPRLRH
jgi:AGZA family xanthine/uracil permease-like MFS transporter